MIRLKRSVTGAAAAVVAGLFVAGCGGGGTGQILGLDRQTPDEFAVVARAPLTLPPDFGLRPPDPEGQRYQDLQARDQAQRAVFGDNALERQRELEIQQREAGATDGEIALLNRFGALEADPSIRRTIDEETAALAAEQESFIDGLVFWRDTSPAGDIIDSNEETRRIQGNAALGQPVTQGQTPIITRSGEESFFEWPF